MTDHRLKIEPVHLDRLKDGSKTHEVRRNDRDYQVGDTITVGRCDDRPSARFGACLGDCSRAHTLTFEITHVLPGDGRNGVTPGYCVLSLDKPRQRGGYISGPINVPINVQSCPGLDATDLADKVSDALRIAKVRADMLARWVKVLDDHHPRCTDPCELCAEWDWMRLELESLKEQP